VTSGTTLFIFLGYVAGPSAFSFLVTASGSWALPMLLVAGQLAVVSAVVGGSLRR
jgi:hypothetical protein